MNSRLLNLDVKQIEKNSRVFKALSSSVRIGLLQSIWREPRNLSDLAKELSLPISSIALHVKVLEEAGLIFSRKKPGARGIQKIPVACIEDVYLSLFKPKEHPLTRALHVSMPLGNYFDCTVTKPCGMASHKRQLGISDSIHAFYSPARMYAQIVWFTSGFLEYRFPIDVARPDTIFEITFNFEICSEAVGFNNDWPSDITVWINHEEVCTFRCAGDYGGKHGIYTPSWWANTSTQYGELHSVMINAQGSFRDTIRSSPLNLESLRLGKCDYISFKIGVKEDAECVGGLNVFGEYFGNYPQNIKMTLKMKR